ncbi:MAG: hypothetical protein ACE5KT_02035 [Methanosarcinales archaeon]
MIADDIKTISDMIVTTNGLLKMYKKYILNLCKSNGFDMIDIEYCPDLDKTSKLALFDHKNVKIYLAPRLPDCLRYCTLVPNLRIQYFMKNVCHEFRHYYHFMNFGVEELDRMLNDAKEYARSCTKWFMTQFKIQTTYKL